MKKLPRVAWILPLLLVLADPSHGAEAVKLRHLTSIYADSNGSALKRPEGVAFDGKSLLAVADTGNGKIQLFTFRDDRLVPQASLALPQLPYPIRLQFDPKGNILVLDGKSRRIALMTATGEFRGYLEPSGVPTPGTVIPRSFKVDGKGNVYLLDVFTGRVLVLDPTGNFQRGIPFPKQHGFFSDLAADGNGDLYLVDSVDGKVYSAKRNASEFTPLSESLKEDLNFPVAIDVDGRGRLYLSDQNGGGIVILGPDGSFRGRQSEFGWKDGLLRYPSGLSVSEGGHLFVADRQNSRVQVFVIVQ
jgi:sugar lactone lactonase YvrE